VGPLGGRPKLPIPPVKIGIPTVRVMRGGGTTYDWEETDVATLAPLSPTEREVSGHIFRVHKPTIIELNYLSPEGRADLRLRYGFFIFRWGRVRGFPVGFRGSYTYSLRIEPYHIAFPYEFLPTLTGTAPTITVRKVS